MEPTNRPSMRADNMGDGGMDSREVDGFKDHDPPLLSKRKDLAHLVRRVCDGLLDEDMLACLNRAHRPLEVEPVRKLWGYQWLWSCALRSRTHRNVDCIDLLVLHQLYRPRNVQ